LVFATLINQATMALYEGLPTSPDFGVFLQKARVSILGVVPSLVKAWRNDPLWEKMEFDSIKCFSSTGECSNFADYFYLMSLANFRPVIEYCGGTEIGGGYISGTLLQRASPGTFTTPCLGIDFKIFDEQGSEAKEGELFLIPPSIGLSTSLLNQDHHEVYFKNTPQNLRRHGDAMKEVFPGWYKGQGRSDDTMNLGGIKVSSAEIERALNSSGGVLETAAVAVEPPGGGASLLVIFAVLKEGMDDIQAAFQKIIREKLNPLFKIHEVVQVKSLPRTASGKVMRRSLRNSYRS
jgi:acetyl-CoA synthetase